MTLVEPVDRPRRIQGPTLSTSAQVIPHGIIFDLHRWRRQIAVSRLDLFYIGLHIVLRELRVVVKGPCVGPQRNSVQAPSSV
jgi:hypothetical protein